MRAYIARRLLAMPFLLLGVITVAFILSHFTQADLLTSILGDRQMGNPAVVQAARERWGLNRPLPVQYGIYVKNLLSGDLGTSFRTRQPVAQDLMVRLPATLELVISAMILGSMVGIGLGVLAARFQDTAIDNFARLFALVGASAPVFWTGLIVLYVRRTHARLRLPFPRLAWSRIASSFRALARSPTRRSPKRWRAHPSARTSTGGHGSLTPPLRGA